jgi:LmbE family N-acetylglucosaminyl deacetylase
MRKQFILTTLLLVSFNIWAQLMPHKSLTSSEILHNIKKLNVVGSALYVAAHPDDENTVMLTWLANERQVKTAYLSINRGDGGQNLIGPEQAELMGLIRTYELLAARNIDGPEQYFTRANDFGFSKNTEETLQIWDKEKVLGDVVYRIRKQRPDVIVCRFPPDARAGHGNHSASAVLAEEAFKISGDPTKYPEQLKYVKPWKAKRVVWNSFTQGFSNNAPADKGYVKAEIGGLNPLLGKSYTELASESRSQHKSQGFGVPRSRGNRADFLLHKDGEEAQTDLFDGIDLSWKRVKGAENITKQVNDIISGYKIENPSASIPALVALHKALDSVDDEFWKKQKQTEIEKIIIAASGLWFEANPNEYAAAGSEKVKVTAAVVKRSDASVVLKRVSLIGLQKDSVANLSLNNNTLASYVFSCEIPKNQPLNGPYWLNERRKNKGMYEVNESPELIGLPEKPADLQAAFTFEIAGQTFIFQTPVLYKWVDPVKGELYRKFEIRPEVTANISDKVYIFSDNQSKNIEITLKATQKSAGEVSLDIPKGWKAEPAVIPFNFEKKYQEQKISFKLTPNGSVGEYTLKVNVKSGNGISSLGLLTINYDHLPPLTTYPFAEAKLVKLDIKTKGKNIGYIAGAGDETAQAIRQIGYNVTTLTEKELSEDLSKFDAIVLGVRAYNTDERLAFYQKKMLDFVANGGTMVVQYQVNSNLSKLDDGIGPYPFKISRDRVTVEEAPIKILKPEHAVFNIPNKISDKDFEGWVQERGLYFANGWAKEYETLIACNDPGESEKEGGLLVAKHGKGNYVFTGLAFFRQLPAGVPGAYRLFANLLSLGK